jgi:hypothetical protein
MKKSLIITLSLVTLLFGQYCSAQIKTTDSSTIKFWDIKRFILNDYKVEQGFIDTACISSIVLVKFKIINSRIDSIEFTKSTPQPIRLALKKALRVDKGGLTLIDGKSYEKKTIIIPIHFAYVMNCKPAVPIEIDSNGAIIDPERKDRLTSLVISFKNMLDFDSGDKASIDCIWLSSIYFTTMY